MTKYDNVKCGCGHKANIHKSASLGCEKCSCMCPEWLVRKIDSGEITR